MPTRKLNILGTEVVLDARPDRLDLRDLPYRPAVVSLDPIYPTDDEVAKMLPAYTKADLILDQGSEGACTGFGLAAVVNFLLWVRTGHKMTAKEKVSPRMLYHLARFYDEWPGEDYEGSSARGALKGWHRHGVCLESLWSYRDQTGNVVFTRPIDGWDSDALRRPLGVYYRVDRQSVVDLQAAILDTGAVYVSANVHEGWGVKSSPGRVIHKTLPVIKPSSKGVGGHAFALVGYNERGFVVQNSWGTKWGASGFAVLTYEDWVANGTDAWAVSLGVPVERLRQRQFYVRGDPTPSGVEPKSGLIGPEPLEKRRADLWPEEKSYWHTIVTGNDGLVINRIPQVENEAENVAFVAREQPLDWFKNNQSGGLWRLAIYAHGGLNAEADSIARIGVLGPYFEANGIYPVFTTWKSGWQEILASMLQDGVNQLFGGRIVPSRCLGDLLVEATDRTLEVFMRGVLGKSIWSEMKENVERSTNKKRGLESLAAQLQLLSAEAQNKLEIHLIGHSAGSFVCGNLLTELQKHNLKVKTCTLYAPACDLGFALRHYKTAIDNQQLARSEFRIHVLADPLELDDTVGPYQKSLLYLVSRALDRWHKTPLLGLASAFDGARATKEFWHEDTIQDQVQPWQQFFWQGNAPRDIADGGKLSQDQNLFVLTDKQVSIGPRRIKSAHGCFDNSIKIIGETLQNILGGNL